MHTGFNANIKLLMGGNYRGGISWNKTSTEIDNCFKVYTLKKGKAGILSNGKVFPIEEGNLYFINGYAIESQKCFDEIIVEWVHFYPESVYLNLILKYSCCVATINPEYFSSFKHISELYQSFFNGEMNDGASQIYKLEIQSFLQLVIANVFKSLDPKIFESDEDFIRLFPALEFIKTNYNEDISLKQVAEICYLSPNYFHRLFTKTFNTSPLSYIRQIRMEEAIRQLVYTNKTIKEIAFDIGYEDEAYFSRTFSKVYGNSPGRYRKENRKNIP